MHRFPLARLHVRLSVLLFAVTMQMQLALLVVCAMVIVSGKLSQDTICSSGLKAAGGSPSRPTTQCVQRWSQRWMSASALLPCCCRFEMDQTHTDPGVGCTGQDPQAETWAMTDALELSAVACPTCPQQIDYSFRTRTAIFFLTPSSEDRWIFSPCFLIGDGLFPDSVASQIYLNVPLQLNTCSVEEVKKKQDDAHKAINHISVRTVQMNFPNRFPLGFSINTHILWRHLPQVHRKVFKRQLSSSLNHNILGLSIFSCHGSTNLRYFSAVKVRTIWSSSESVFVII